MTVCRANSVAKSQSIRILDVVLIGPIMMYGAYHLPFEYRWTRALLFFFGVSTVVYNANNYYQVRRMIDAETESSLQGR